MSDLPAAGTTEILIEKLVVGGEGLGHLPDGRVIFVPFVIPGEIIRTEIIQNKKDFARGRVLEILQPSPHRVAPPCPYHGICGGCGLQHIREDAQRRLKETMLAEEIRRHFPDRPPQVMPLLFAGQTIGYRERIQLHQRAGEIGYYEAASHRICAIDRCIVASEPINQKIAELQARPDLRPLADRIEISQVNNVLHVKQSMEKGDFVFSQVNPFANELLKQALVTWTKENPAEIYVDLYCGNGNLSLPLLREHPRAKLVGVEYNAESVHHATKLARKENLAGVFYRSAVEEFLLRRELPPESHVLLDPPRAGLSALARTFLKRDRVKRIFYVSCSLPTFLRDAKVLAETMKFTRLQPIEFFPQTPHIEILAEFEG